MPTKLNTWDEADLRWYFADSDGALGAQSGHGPMVAAAMGARGGGVASSWNAILVAHHRMADVARERRIRAAVTQLTVGQARALELVYGPRRPLYGTEEARRYFGPVLPIVHSTPTGNSGFPGAPGDAFTAWLTELFTRKESLAAATLLRAMRQEAVARLALAEEGYTAAREGRRAESAKARSQRAFQARCLEAA